MSDDWDGGDFTCTIINEMLKGGSVHGPFWRHLPTSICAQTMFRGELNQLFQINALHRQQMNWQAVRLVENTCDDCIIEKFARDAILGRTPALRGVVRRTLEDFFMPLLEDAHKRDTFEHLVQQHTAELPEAIRDFRIYVDADKLRVNWPSWLQMYRHAFSDLEREIGLPIQIPVGEIALEELPAKIDLVK